MSTSFHVVAAGGVPDTGDIPRAEQPRALPSVPQTEIKKEVKPAIQAPDTGDNIKVIIQAFTFSGNQSFSNEQLSALLMDFEKREIGFKDLNEATKIITAFYRENGYFLAQAYLPAQDIAANTVEIAILEGKLGTLKLSGADDLNKAFMEKMAIYQLGVGGSVSEYNLVRNVTLLNALPGVDATAQLNPSSIVGATDIEVTLAPQPRLQGYIGANAYGNRFTGREVVLAGVQLNNPAGLGDQFSLNVKRSNNNGQRGVDLRYITPILASGTTLSLGYNYVDYKLGRELAPLDAFGESQYFNISIDQPILRDAHKGISFRYGTSYKVMNDEVATASLENRRNIFGADFGIYGDWLNEAGSVSNQVGLNIRTGKVMFKDDTAQALDESGAKTKGGFVKYSLSATRLQYFENGISLALQADYQRASKNLDSVEKLSIGGINRWRRFAELPSLADTGLAVGAELRKRISANKLLASISLVDISPFGFIDVGRGKVNQKTSANDNHVKSMHFGLGLDATFKNTWLFNVTASHQNRDFEGADAENEVRVWGQLIKYF
ncbi:MAG: ShlB/FhaC/HecB family hemolysin secretion/activation protein [Methylophilaceae bacterium]